MSKKLMTGLLALVALAALALPAAAAASPEIGETSGGVFTKLASGSKIQGTSLAPSKMTSPGGTVLTECSTASMTGELTENSGTSIKGTISAASFTNAGGAACSTFFGGTATVTTNVGNGLPWCLQSAKEDKFEVRGNACSAASRSITFVLDTSTAGVCKYNSSVFPVGTFTTDVAPSNSDAILSLTKAGLWTKEEGSFLCPSEASLDMEFTLETDGTSIPLYIR